MDRLNPERRSRLMSRVRSNGNASTEMRLIAVLRSARISGWRRGSSLPGRPDFVFRHARLAIFVDGCYWHGCPRCGRQSKSRVEFWAEKIARNRLRDRRANAQLRRRGWRVLRLWEHSLKIGMEEVILARVRAVIDKVPAHGKGFQQNEIRSNPIRRKRGKPRFSTSPRS